MKHKEQITDFQKFNIYFTFPIIFNFNFYFLKKFTPNK